jgi:RNA polymerase sigma factor (sigma-70 family)
VVGGVVEEEFRRFVAEAEPRLPAGLACLPERQRVSVILVYAAGWSLSEVADLLGISKSSVQRHVDRGLAKLRRAIGADDG